MRSQSHHNGAYPKRSLSLTSATTNSSDSTERSDEKKPRRISNPLSTKLFPTRSRSPSPVMIPKHNRQNSSGSQTHDIPRSNPPSYFDHHYHSTNSGQMSPDSTSLNSPKSPKLDYAKRAPTPTRKTGDDYRRYSGTINHYGRHSNDWLFGGFSVRDTVRDGIEKLRHHDKES